MLFRSSYETFYEKLYQHLEKFSWLDQERNKVSKHYTDWMNNGKIDYCVNNNINIHGWNLIHSTLINLQHSNQFDNLYSFLHKFILEFDLEESVAQDLIQFQKNYVINYNDILSYPKIVNTKYNFLGYIKEGTVLLDPSQYQFDYVENKELTFQQYCEHLFFSRRKNFGKSLIKKLLT